MKSRCAVRQRNHPTKNSDLVDKPYNLRTKITFKTESAKRKRKTESAVKSKLKRRQMVIAKTPRKNIKESYLLVQVTIPLEV